MSDCHYAT